MVDENLSELKKMLKRAQIDEEYRIYNKNYLEEAKMLYDEISKKVPQAKTTLELLLRRLNRCDLCEKGKEPGVFKASIMRAFREYVEKIDPTSPNYKQKVNNLEYSMLYLSTDLVLYATYMTFSKKLQENLREYNSLEEAYRKTSEDIETAIGYLIEDPKGHGKWFEEYMQVNKLSYRFLHRLYKLLHRR